MSTKIQKKRRGLLILHNFLHDLLTGCNQPIHVGKSENVIENVTDENVIEVVAKDLAKDLAKSENVTTRLHCTHRQTCFAWKNSRRLPSVLRSFHSESNPK